MPRMKATIVRHGRVGTPNFRCPICNGGYKTILSAQRHVTRIHKQSASGLTFEPIKKAGKNGHETALVPVVKAQPQQSDMTVRQLVEKLEKQHEFMVDVITVLKGYL